jgi:hypothetical protein
VVLKMVELHSTNNPTLKQILRYIICTSWRHDIALLGSSVPLWCTSRGHSMIPSAALLGCRPTITPGLNATTRYRSIQQRRELPGDYFDRDRSLLDQ